MESCGLKPLARQAYASADVTMRLIKQGSRHRESFGCIVVLLAVLGFVHLIAKSTPEAAIASQGLALSGFVSQKIQHSNPTDINCGEEVGVTGKDIPLDHQYHDPVSWRAQTVVSEDDFVGPQVCRSKRQQHCFWRHSNYTPSSSFLVALRNYEAYHRKCTAGENLTHHALQGSVPNGCQYLVYRDVEGRGNQIMSLVSAFVYSLLTDRTLLVRRGAELQNLFCEPFWGSSWLLPEDFPDDRIREEAEMHGVFYEKASSCLNTMKNCSLDSLEMPKFVEAFISHRKNLRNSRFFCETEQKLLSGIPWVFFRSNLYLVPPMYYIPNLRAKLNSLFPDRAVFLHAGRYLLSPEEQVWARILRIYRSYMADADRRLSIQVRAWESLYKPIIGDHILACAQHVRVLPMLNPSEKLGTVSPPSDGMLGPQLRKAFDPPERIAVVLTSLRREYAEGLQEVFSEGDAVSGERVTVIIPSAEEQQRTGQIIHDRRAVADMWLLSFAADIITTPRSTFGYVAHGLAGIKPIVLRNYGQDKTVPSPPCARTSMPGPCQLDPHQITCPLDGTEVDKPGSFVPEVRLCELQWGIGVFEGDSSHNSTDSIR